MESQRSPGATKISDKKTKLSALIVDDDGVIRSIHKAMLEGLFKIETKLAKNGKEAVDLHCSGANFDIVFMDREMPIMDGIEATKQLRAMGVKSMIVGITTRADGKEGEEFLAAGLNKCFGKPLTSAIIEAVLQDLQN
ncbi:Signal transduction response regulator, receiver domain [Sesbania bispinosa]|nr:Signal transduction response regulator, receiver domain [Sesbania bispinosa]